jgi:hypothetical protein
MGKVHLPGRAHSGIDYADFLARYIRESGARTYLEIGVNDGASLSRVQADTAIGVDPSFSLAFNVAGSKRAVHLFQETSDAFFASPEARAWTGGIDFAFLDGMHLVEYLLRDFFNTEALCTSKSIIAMHDCMPFTAAMIARDNRRELRTDPHADAWTGDVWKIVPILKKHRPDLRVALVDCFPTGLVCVSNLDPISTVLKDSYAAIVGEFLPMSNDEAALAKFYSENEFVSASDFLARFP